MKSFWAFLLLFWCTLQAGAATFSGSGTTSAPYLIQSLSDLQALAKSVYDGTSYKGKYFKQTADIVANQGVIKSDGTFNESGKASFTPWTKPAGRVYGLWTSHPFEGNYDGGNHTITGLYFEKDLDEAYVGLFGYAQNGIIQNLTIKDSYMATKANASWNDNYHGFLVGLAKDCTIINCHVQNSVMDIVNNRDIIAGGLIGCAEASSASMPIKNSSFSGTLNATTQSDDVYAAGLVGQNTGSKKYVVSMEGCSANGNLNLVIDFKKGGSQAFLSGFANCEASSNKVDMSECANRINFNVTSINFTSVNDIRDPYFLDKYKEMDKLCIHPMCESANQMTNCASFGDINLGTTENALGHIDELVIAPVRHLYTSMNSCAFYGMTNMNCKNVANIYTEEGHYSSYVVIFQPKVYTVSADIKSGTTISRVLRQENYDLTEHYIQDLDNVPSGVRFYRGLDLKDIKKDAAIIIQEFSGYDSNKQQTYKWGLLTDENYYGCPAPLFLTGNATMLVGSGTASDPYLIQSEKDYIFAVTSINDSESSGKYYKLIADLDLSTSGTYAAIGTTEHPFSGHFDGNGHSIAGLKAMKGSMFDEVKGGTIENLTLLDLTAEEVDACYPLVRRLSNDNDNQLKGTISNCYVGGTIQVNKGTFTSSEMSVAGLCGTCDGGVIENSYFKGKFQLSGNAINSYTKVAGICKEIASKASINDCYSIFHVSAENNCILNGVYGITCADEKLGSDMLETDGKLYFMTDHEGVSAQNGTQVSSYSELKMGDAYIKGVYNPVLKSAKHYALTDGRGLDAVICDEEVQNDKTNYILHYKPAAGEDYENDRNLWMHPNLAVYNAEDDAEYLINCSLDATKDLKLNMDNAASKTIKANMHYPLSIYNPKEGALLQMLCLPVTVKRNALPEGSKLKIVGTKAYDKANSRYVSTMVDCDSVPAGVPFILEIPKDKTSADKDATFDLVLRGTVAPEPAATFSVGDDVKTTELVGTYLACAKPSGCLDKCLIDGGTYQVTKTDAKTVSPFHAYALMEEDSDNTEYVLDEHLLLDEESAEVSSMLQAYAGKTTNVILKRTMKANVWNTVCLPFDLSADEIANAFGEGTKVEALSRIENDATEGATIVFAKATEMRAGKAYLVKPAESGKLYNLVDKVIKNEIVEEPDDEATDIYFMGRFAPALLSGAPVEQELFIYFIQGNKLYYLPDDQSVALKGFRGWIIICTNIFGTEPATSARLRHADGSTTDLRAIPYGKSTDASRIYNMQGIQLPTMQKGVNIVGGKKIMK